MVVKHSIIVPKRIAQDIERCKALPDREVPCPLLDEFTISCSSTQGIALECTIDCATVAAAYMGIRNALNLEAPA